MLIFRKFVGHEYWHWRYNERRERVYMTMREVEFARWEGARVIDVN
jgi:hypothetical protein